MDRDLINKATEGIAYEEKVSVIAYENIVFFSLAEGGAMGCPGEVLIATKTNDAVKWYCLNTMTIPHKETWRWKSNCRKGQKGAANTDIPVREELVLESS